MNVKEVLSFQPDVPSVKNDVKNERRKQSLVIDQEEILNKKRRVEAKNNDSSVQNSVDVLLNDNEDESNYTIDEAKLKRMILNFEKQFLRNQEMRIKFVDVPEKFMESEVKLHESIQELHVVATVPELYYILVELKSAEALLQLLSHQNTDISIAVVELLEEITEPDTLAESPESADSLIEKLLEGQMCALIVSNMDRLDENTKEESDGIHSSLAVMENLAEARPEQVTSFASQGLMNWLLRRLSKKGFHPNKLYAAELLSILLQNQNEDNCKLLGEMEGIDTLLQQLAVFKRHDPTTAEDLELMENLFTCLCAALMLPVNKERFLRGEGLQLMNLMLREKKQARHSSVKVLDYALSGPHGSDNCSKFVEILGLRSIFPLFMRPPLSAAPPGSAPGSKRHRRGARAAAAQMEEHLVSVLGALLRHCSGSNKQRVLGKFVERDHEKIDRLLELHFNYQERVDLANSRLARDPLQRQLAREKPELAKEELFLRCLEAGLFTLQQVDTLIVQVCVEGAPSIRRRVEQLLSMRGARLRHVAHNVRTMCEEMGEEAAIEMNRLSGLLEKFQSLTESESSGNSNTTDNRHNE